MCPPDPKYSGPAGTPLSGARARRQIDAEVARLASRQHGVLSRSQLLDAGLEVKAIDYRLRIGRLVAMHRGVYAVGHVPPSRHAWAMAAMLACGKGAVLSHRSAAWLWGILQRWPEPVEVIDRWEHTIPGVRIHRSRTLDPSQVTTNFGIPVTTLARTVLDLADVVDDRALTRAVNEARLKRRSLLQELAVLLPGNPGRRGAARLRPFVHRSAGPTRSEFEDAFLAFAARYGLPDFEVNADVGGYEVDILWPAQKLIVELDSRTHHDDPASFERDRERDADLLVAGYLVLRITWERLTQRPEREAERLHALLAARTELAEGGTHGPRRGHP